MQDSVFLFPPFSSKPFHALSHSQGASVVLPNIGISMGFVGIPDVDA